MSNPWDNIKDKDFSGEERQKLRYVMETMLEREPMNSRIVLAYKSRWIVVAVIAVASAGNVRGAAEFIAKIAGLL